MKKVLALLLAALMLMSFAACGKQAADDGPAAPAKTDNSTKTDNSAKTDNSKTSGDAVPAEPDYVGKTLTLGLNMLPESLIIQNIKNNTATNYIMPALYSRLYDYNENDELVPNLATGYEWKSETELRIFLRDDICTASGLKITAEDVKYSFTVGKDGVNASAYALIEDVVVENDTTAVVVFGSPNPTFVDSLGDESFAIVSASGVEKDGGMDTACKAPVDCTTGPYEYYEWVEGQYITLKYNENYYDKDYVPSYEFITYTVIPDNASRCLAVQSGDIDIAAGLGLADTLGYTGNAALGVGHFPTNLATALFFNCSEGIFTNEKLRQAIGYLIDWQECADVVSGAGSKLVEASMPRSSAYFYENYNREYNVEKGLALMAEAGYPNGFSFEITTAQPQAHHTNVALLVQAQLAEFGINVTVNPLDLGIFFGVIDGGSYEAMMSNCSSSFSVHMAYFDDYKTRAQNYGGPQLSDPYVTDLVNKARAEFDYNKRNEYVQAIQEYMVEHRVGYGITDELSYCLYNAELLQDMSSDVKGLKPQYVRPVA